jgi:hypothetical protein
MTGKNFVVIDNGDVDGCRSAHRELMSSIDIGAYPYYWTTNPVGPHGLSLFMQSFRNDLRSAPCTPFLSARFLHAVALSC